MDEEERVDGVQVAMDMAPRRGRRKALLTSQLFFCGSDGKILRVYSQHRFRDQARLEHPARLYCIARPWLYATKLVR